MKSLSLCHQTFFANLHDSLEICWKIADGGKKARETIYSASRAFCGINASLPYGDTQIVSSSLGRGPPLFVKVNAFTLKKCPPVVSCQGLQRDREGREKEGEG